ncbi:hypothetical protein ANCCAN_28397 [Ancylostoma caninum]|uniref:Uncharacterized protein n=1 Tax=Ancylostoma caninum TaxID=29170 RepID=A0A368F6S0_ANCCA|nr:hypothetical protein ANCCAN_28397 [Ancylostoma caninum]
MIMIDKNELCLASMSDNERQQLFILSALLVFPQRGNLLELCSREGVSHSILSQRHVCLNNNAQPLLLPKSILYRSRKPSQDHWSMALVNITQGMREFNELYVCSTAQRRRIDDVIVVLRENFKMAIHAVQRWKTNEWNFIRGYISANFPISSRNSRCTRSFGLSGEEECVCDGDSHTQCFAVESAARHGEDYGDADTKKHIRVRRGKTRVYEKILSQYEGILAVYSMCRCTDKHGCVAIKEKVGLTIDRLGFDL